MVFAGPYSGGTSRQRPPVFRIWRMPLITRRSSTRGLPGWLWGRCGSRAAQALSDSQNRSRMFSSMPPRPRSGGNQLILSVIWLGPLHRVPTHLVDPEADGCNEGESGEEVLGQPVVSGRDAPPVLEPAEHAFDEIAPAVRLAAHRAGPLAARTRRDHRLDVMCGEQSSEGISIIGFVAEQPPG